ncbi:MAG: glycosyl hydrolase, partial [Opitutae bacterium]|nr:glycosyl hydrolase [Opitutae bacterium]
MKTIGLFAVALCISNVTTKAKVNTGSQVKQKGFISLFDGKSLKGWEGKKKFFRVEDGAIVAGFL